MDVRFEIKLKIYKENGEMIQECYVVSPELFKTIRGKLEDDYW